MTDLDSISRNILSSEDFVSLSGICNMFCISAVLELKDSQHNILQSQPEKGGHKARPN